MTRRASVRKRGRVPKPGTSAQALHGVVVGREQVGHLRIELAEMVFDHPQFFQNEQGGRQSDNMPEPFGYHAGDSVRRLPSSASDRTTHLRSRGRGQRVLEAEGVAPSQTHCQGGVDVDALDLTAGTTSLRPHHIAAFFGG